MVGVAMQKNGCGPKRLRAFQARYLICPAFISYKVGDCIILQSLKCVTDIRLREAFIRLTIDFYALKWTGW